jgi:hypothetical protein
MHTIDHGLDHRQDATIYLIDGNYQLAPDGAAA